MTTVNNFNVIKRNYLEKVKEYNQKYNEYTLKIEELEDQGEFLNNKIFELNKEYISGVKEPSWFNDVLQPLANEVKEKTKEETMSNFETYLLSYLENLNEFQDSTREVDLKIAECNAKIREVISQATTLRRERDRVCKEPSWAKELVTPLAIEIQKRTNLKIAFIAEERQSMITEKVEVQFINNEGERITMKLIPGDLSKGELRYLSNDNVLGSTFRKELPDNIDEIIAIMF